MVESPSLLPGDFGIRDARNSIPWYAGPSSLCFSSSRCFLVMVGKDGDIVSPIDKAKAIECLGDEAIFETMVASFLEEVDQMMVVLDQAVSEGDETTIKEKAHWVKGGLVYLHATPSADAAKKLEMAADLGPERIKVAHEELRLEVDRLKDALSGGSAT